MNSRNQRSGVRGQRSDVGCQTGDLLAWGKRAELQRSDDRGQKTESGMELRVIEMKAVLRDRRIVHASEFAERFGWDERTCRAIAAASEGHILGTNGGYVLNHRATQDEFDEANGRIYSQGKKMMRRAIRERRVRHEMISGRSRVSGGGSIK